MTRRTLSLQANSIAGQEKFELGLDKLSQTWYNTIMTNNNNTKRNTMNTQLRTFTVGDIVTWTPQVLNDPRQVVTIVGATELRDSMGQLCQAICRKANGVDQIIHIENLTPTMQWKHYD